MARKLIFRLFLCLTLLFIAMLVPSYASAIVGPNIINIGLPFGGRVVTMLPIGCPDGIEVFLIAPVRPSFPSGPYYIGATTRRYLNFSVGPGSWILGLYNPVPKICATYSVPPVPVPVLPVKMFGSSLF